MIFFILQIRPGPDFHPARKRLRLATAFQV
jgi:hypothetical protein